MQRSVTACPGQYDTLISAVDSMTRDQAVGYVFLCRQLERDAPDPDHLCGVIDGNREVYALPIAEPNGPSLVVSVLYPPGTGVLLHKVADTSPEQACMSARAIVIGQLGISATASWETKR